MGPGFAFPTQARQLSGRIEFVILRTDRSPPAAPHPALLRRSCSRLQAGESVPEEDFHLSDPMRFQAHVGRLCQPPHGSDRLRLASHRDALQISGTQFLYAHQ